MTHHTSHHQSVGKINPSGREWSDSLNMQGILHSDGRAGTPSLESHQHVLALHEKAIEVNVSLLMEIKSEAVSTEAPAPRRFKSDRKSSSMEDLNELSRRRSVEHIRSHRRAAAQDLAETEGPSLKITELSKVSIDDVRKILRSLSS